MFCSKCGNQIADESGFCPKCGSKVRGGIVETTAATKAVIKSKKKCIYDAMCNYMRAADLITGINPTFGDLEEYEEGMDGSVYCELVASTRNAFGQTKKTRYGAVIQEVEADGNVVFKSLGPQLVSRAPGWIFLS
ncbi:MAG: zinc ribbon domain-containing protein [Christensenellaceae bacterium]|nr:zinc ribbon domain-containing protein [Christensenellaceae bacterium]